MSNNPDYLNKEDEMDLDELIQPIIEELKFEEEMPAILDPVKMEQMKFAYAALQHLAKCTNATISYELNEPFKTVGTITVEGKSLEFFNAEWFSRALEFASNTEVYPLTNGKVRMTLTFHSIARLMK